MSKALLRGWPSPSQSTGRSIGKTFTKQWSPAPANKNLKKGARGEFQKHRKRQRRLSQETQKMNRPHRGRPDFGPTYRGDPQPGSGITKELAEGLGRATVPAIVGRLTSAHPFLRNLRIARTLLDHWGLVNTYDPTYYKDLPGWSTVLQCTPTGGPDWHGDIGQTGPSYICLILQAGGQPIGQPIDLTGAERYTIASSYETSPGNIRWDTFQQMNRDVAGKGANRADGLQREYEKVGEAVRPIQPYPLPNIDPDIFPPGMPINPTHLPWDVRQPTRRDYQAHHREAPKGRNKQVETPAWQTTITIRNNGNGRITGRSVNRRPFRRGHGGATVRNDKPKRNEKETKFGSGPVAAVASTMAKWGMTPTEIFDFIDAIYEALPDKVQDKADNPYDKAKKIYDNFDDLDWTEAGYNLIYNHVEDKIVGGIMQRLQKAGLKSYGNNWQNFRNAMGKQAFTRGPVNASEFGARNLKL